MVTTSGATVALILVALVGCGPKYAPFPECFHYVNTTCSVPVNKAPPSIDPNPYRFIGGQRYGEGWDHK